MFDRCCGRMTSFNINKRKNNTVLNTSRTSPKRQSLHSIWCCKKQKQERTLFLGRTLFLLSLAIVAVALGVLAEYFLSASEVSVGEHQFTSIADRALSTAYEIVVRKRSGAVSCASVVAAAFPNASIWPFVALNGYEMISSNIIAASSGREMGLVPIVQVEQIEEFEKFAYNYYTRSRIPPFPNGTGIEAGVSEFGFGIWGEDPTLPNSTDQRYHVTSGSNKFNSPNNIVTPIIQHNLGSSPILLLNMHFEESRGVIIDHMIDCAQKRKHSAEMSPNSTQYHSIECIFITDIITLVNADGPGAVILQPIYPYNDDTILKGFIATSILWEETLQNVFTKEILGVCCVLRTETQIYTYYIQHGIPVLLGPGDLHDPAFDEFRREIKLTGDGLFGTESGIYYLTIYPASDFFDVYSTSNPTVAAIGAALIIVFTSFLFMLYDYTVQREFDSKQELLNAKRRFMRFVSHEVRNPLNSVIMGLSLLQEEIEAAFELQLKPIFCTYSDKDEDDEDEQDSSDSSKIDDYTNGLQNSLSQTLQELMGKAQQNGALSQTQKCCHAVPASPRLVYHETPQHEFEQSKARLQRKTTTRYLEWLQLTHDVHSNALSAVAVLNDLLNYDKIEMGNLQLELSANSICDLVKCTANEFNLSVVKKKIHYKIEFCLSIPDLDSITSDVTTIQDVASGCNRTSTCCSDTRPESTSIDQWNSPRVIGDSIRLAQCIRNLLSNAVKFTPNEGFITVRGCWINREFDGQEGGKITDTFDLISGETVSYERNGLYELSVTDSGPGMSREQLNQLFRDGVQFNANKLQGGNGSGLGLYITKGIIEQHGGTLFAESEGIGKGTTFTLTLPVHNVPQTDKTYIALFPDTAHPENTENVNGKAQSETFRILIVDDATINRKLLRKMLEKHGHICDEAENGKVALDLVANSIKTNRKYDTILMDSEMPVMNGPDSVTRMRKLGCDTFIVGLTGNVLPEDITYFKNHGVDTVLSKPFALKDLEDVWTERGLRGCEHKI